MTKLLAALHAVFLLAVVTSLAACGRSDIEVAAGGASPTGCQTNAGCASTPDTPVCLVPPGQCVECLTSPDTCPSGEACDATTHTCVPVAIGCKSDVECAAPTPHCRLDTHVCVECTSSDQCPTGQQCADFQCVGFCGGGAACPGGFACCDPLCVNVTNDPDNCGGCGAVCGPFPQASATCSNQACAIGACFFGFADCDQFAGDGCEIDTLSDPNNCGSCGNACLPGQGCSGGTCVGACGGQVMCTTGLTCCGPQCANTQSDPKNCGTCGAICTSVPSGSTACIASACQIVACDPGFANCNGKVADGCEVDTSVDPSNCGTCGNACPSGASCIAGTCQSTSCQMIGCPGGLACCSDKCLDVSSDLANCGGCGNACPPGASSCKSGGCCFLQPGGGEICSAIVCPDPLQNCFNVCVDQSNDEKNCGGCGIFCGPDEKCTNGSCLSNCNGGPMCGPQQSCCPSGCASTSTDTKNCGFCGNICPMGSNCVAGACQATCNGGPACGPTQSCCGSGCASIISDPNNCGFCGNVCPTGSNCVAGACQATCNGGPACGATQKCCMTGCADPLTDVKNCGGCGITCPAGNICVAGGCQATCNGGPACTGSQSCCATGCSDTASDVKNCGGCGITCGATQTCTAGMCVTPMACNGGPACSPAQTCCSTGCADLKTDGNHCGNCTTVCGPTAACVNGSCQASEGAFNPIVNPTFLAPGVHNFTTINVPAGVTIYVAGPGATSGTLDLRATGAIVIDGVIDLSGGPGTQNTITSMSTQSGRAGSGGYTGEPYQSAAQSAACQFIAGNPGQLGFQLKGTPGTCNILSTSICVGQMDPTALIWAGPPAQFGGGGGVFTGYRAYGGGGGGPAGGAPGALGAAFGMQQDCTGASGGGGAVGGKGGVGGSATYNGKNGALGQTQCQGVNGFPPAYVGGGGGGAIGVAAAMDLAVASTFQTGSGGGGGSSDYLNRPVFGGTSGGGGGGGAIKLSTPSTITITGQLLVNGGPGGDAFIGNGVNAGCDPQPGAAGGGGSGGVIYLSAPSIQTSSAAVLSAAGGPGGAGSLFATGGAGGNGGLGRIRLSVTPASCTLAGSFTPPRSAAGCAAASASGFAFIGTYPN